MARIEMSPVFFTVPLPPTQLRESLQQLKQGLMSLPVPKNDFEIVLPENAESGLDDTETPTGFIEDASEVENRKQVFTSSLSTPGHRAYK